MPGGPFGLGENPFGEGHDARFLYPCRAHWEAVTRLRRAVEDREPFVYLTGPAGCGKTTAVLEFLAGLESHTAVVIAATDSLTPGEFHERVLAGLGVESGSAVGGGPADRLGAALREHASSGVVVLVVDESQNLGPEVLEELMALSDLEADGERLVQIVLAGRPVLERILSGPGREALRPCFAARCWLGAFSAEETEGYIRHRLSAVSGPSRSLFSSDSCQKVHRLTKGIPRDINVLASEALVQAEAAGATTVAPDHVTAAARVTGLIRPEAEAWVARFGRPCETPGIEARIRALRSLFGVHENRTDDPADPPSSPWPTAEDAADGSEGGTPRPGHPERTMMLAAGVLFIASVGLLLTMGNRQHVRGRAPYRPAAETRAVRTDAPPTPAVTPQRASPPKRSRPAAPGARAVATAKRGTPAPANDRRYGLVVATFVFEDRAVEEREKLAASVPFACRVVGSLEGDARVYQVVVGPLASRSEAESLGADLVARGVAGEARVVRWAAADSTHR